MNPSGRTGMIRPLAYHSPRFRWFPYCYLQLAVRRAADSGHCGATPRVVVSADQLKSLALLFYDVNEMGAAIAVVFFGFSTLITGWLIIRSTYLPRFLGWFAVVGGIGWLSFLWPPLGYRINLYVAAVGLLGSLATIGWLIVVGVNESRWVQRISFAPN